MILYHGSLVTVESPRILSRANNHGMDFGSGFYVTSVYEQAVKWVHIRQKNAAQAIPGYVSFYEAPDNLLAIPELKTKLFLKPSRQWLRFVHNNRNTPTFTHNFDVVKGPVANDRVYATLTLWENGFFDEEQTIRRLKTFKLFDQFLFHTENALTYLHFIKALEVL